MLHINIDQNNQYQANELLMKAIDDLGVNEHLLISTSVALHECLAVNTIVYFTKRLLAGENIHLSLLMGDEHFSELQNCGLIVYTNRSDEEIVTEIKNREVAPRVMCDEVHNDSIINSDGMINEQSFVEKISSLGLNSKDDSFIEDEFQSLIASSGLDEQGKDYLSELLTSTKEC